MANVVTLPKMTPSKVKGGVIRCIQAGLVPFIQSSPGMGKSSIVRQVANWGNLKVIDLRLSQCAPEDLQGLPMKTQYNGRDKSKFVPFEEFPIEGDPIPEGYNGWLLFLDEFNSGLKSTQAAAYKLILDRLVGNNKLHPKVAIVCAGNHATDKAIVNTMSTAMTSRMISMHMILSKDEWSEWANQEKLDFRVTGWIDHQPTELHVFDPEKTDGPFRCPRTWHFVSDLIQNRKELDEDDLALMSGAVGAAGALLFYNYSKHFASIPSLQTILADPGGAPLPTELSARWATQSMLSAYADETNIKKIIDYMKRFRPEEELIFYRNAFNRNPKLRSIDEARAQLVRVMHVANGV